MIDRREETPPYRSDFEQSYHNLPELERGTGIFELMLSPEPPVALLRKRSALLQDAVASQ